MLREGTFYWPFLGIPYKKGRSILASLLAPVVEHPFENNDKDGTGRVTRL